MRPNQVRVQADLPPPGNDALHQDLSSLWPESAANSTRGMLATGSHAPLDPTGLPSAVLLQEPGSYEPWEVAKAIRTSQTPVHILRVSTAHINTHQEALRAGRCTPVGNADFIRAAMATAGINEPSWTCYPRDLATHMLQQPRRTPASRALASAQPLFIKPVSGAHFKGFIMRRDRGAMDAVATQQLERLLDRPRSELVWVADPLAILSEWRYYVLEGEVVGFSRAWPNVGIEPKSPHLGDISTIIAGMPNDCAYALDVAVLESGQTTVLGARDALALSLIPFGNHAPPALDYLRMLAVRWCALQSQATE